MTRFGSSVSLAAGLRGQPFRRWRAAGPGAPRANSLRRSGRLGGRPAAGAAPLRPGGCRRSTRRRRCRLRRHTCSFPRAAEELGVAQFGKPGSRLSVPFPSDVTAQACSWGRAVAGRAAPPPRCRCFCCLPPRRAPTRRLPTACNCLTDFCTGPDPACSCWACCGGPWPPATPAWRSPPSRACTSWSPMRTCRVRSLAASVWQACVLPAGRGCLRRARLTRPRRLAC